MTDDRLTTSLTDLADHLAFPAEHDLAPDVMRILATPAPPAPRAPYRRRRVIAVAVGSVVALFAFPGPREAVADWLGLSAVQIVRVDEVPADIGTTLRLGREVPVGSIPSPSFTVVAPPSPGPPQRAYVDEPATGSVTLVWAATDDLPEIHDTGVGLLLTEIPGRVDEPLLEKRLDEHTTIERVPVGSAMGYWIAGGAHELLYLAPDGSVRPDTTRLAANTLIWTANGIVFRLETALDRAAAVDLANSLQPLR